MEFLKDEAELLLRYSCNKRFMLEVGGGISTEILAQNARKHNSIFVSIDVIKKPEIAGVIQLTGWSIRYSDIIKSDDKDFIDIKDRGERKRYPWADRKVAFKLEKEMTGETDLIRRSIENYGSPDFVFCDSGEFCGLSEWRVLKPYLETGCIFCCHDIYYPKSVKSFKVVEDISKLSGWKILHKTNSKQGLLIAEKI